MVNQFSEQERRKYRRVYASLPMQFREIGEFDKLPRDTITKDLSEGGVRFTAEKFVPVGNRLVVNISLESRSEAVRAIVKIAWARRQQFSDAYELGCQFVNVEEESKSRISRFIAHQPPA